MLFLNQLQIKIYAFFVISYCIASKKINFDLRRTKQLRVLKNSKLVLECLKAKYADPQLSLVLS